MEAFTAGAITMYTVNKLYNWYTNNEKEVPKILHLQR